MEPWNHSQEETKESSTLVLLNFYCLYQGIWKGAMKM